MVVIGKIYPRVFPEEEVYWRREERIEPGRRAPVFVQRDSLSDVRKRGGNAQVVSLFAAVCR